MAYFWPNGLFPLMPSDPHIFQKSFLVAVVVGPAKGVHGDGHIDFAALAHTAGLGGVLLGLHIHLHAWLSHWAAARHAHIQVKHASKATHDRLQAGPAQITVTTGGGDVTAHLRAVGLLRVRLIERLGAQGGSQRGDMGEELRKRER